MLYIFEPTIREIHQAPDDYFRFTPYSLKKILRKLVLTSSIITFVEVLSQQQHIVLIKRYSMFQIKKKE